MKNKIIALSVLLAGLLAMPFTANAGGGGVALEDANIDVHNQASLQRGVKYYVNYCMGCHALGHARYNRVAQDLGLTDKLVIDNLIFTVDEDGKRSKVGMLMKNGMSQKDSAEWFGAPPPDLTLVARVRSEDWIYTYLKSFYRDPSRPMGVNNTVFPNVGMPHVLWELQGWQDKVETTTVDAEGHKHHSEELVLKAQGQMSPVEYEQMIRDITGFLSYVAEPAQLHRKSIGVWVLLFLGVLFVFAYLMKKEFWKDVH